MPTDSQDSKEMRVYNKEEARERINGLARAGREFVFIINYAQTQAYIEEVCDIDSSELLFSFPHFSNVPPGLQPSGLPLEWQVEVPDREVYGASIGHVKRNIRAGNSYLTNLTCKMPLTTNMGLSELFLRSEARYRCWLRDRFVCFSPETFVTIDHGTICSYPMKGTCDASLPDAEATLMANAKEAAEHATIVDLIRNDLSLVADEVRVRRYRYVDRLATSHGPLLQTSSEITGELTPHYRQHLGDLLFRLLPAGSITGAPKPMTMRIISEAEGYDRGFYTGIMGHHVAGRVDSAVMIRFVDQEDGRLYYKAGGGITAYSNDDDEYQEVIQKVYVPIH